MEGEQTQFFTSQTCNENDITIQTTVIFRDFCEVKVTFIDELTASRFVEQTSRVRSLPITIFYSRRAHEPWWRMKPMGEFQRTSIGWRRFFRNVQAAGDTQMTHFHDSNHMVPTKTDIAVKLITVILPFHNLTTLPAHHVLKWCSI